MPEWIGVVTNAGDTLLSQWALGGKLNFNSAEAGSGTVPVASLLAQTSLLARKQTVSIVDHEKVSKGVKLLLRITAPQTGYTLNQYGVWAVLDGGQPILLAIFQREVGVPIPSKDDSPEFVYSFYALIAMSNEGNFTVNIDTSASVSLATMNKAIDTMAATKVDKEAGKRLMTEEEGAKLAGITAEATKTQASNTNGCILLDGKEVRVYSHPTGAGNAHIPAGGVAGQVVQKTASGYGWADVDPAGTAESKVDGHNTSPAAHTDIRQAASAAQATADEAKSIAQGRSKAVTYASYSALVAALNAMARTELRVGDNLYVQTKEVPDLWVSSVELASSAYSYTTDAALVTSLTAVGAVQMGYYKVAMLETAKVDLSGYVPIIRKVNGKALSADITLRAGDIATASGETIEASLSNKANAGDHNLRTYTSFAQLGLTGPATMEQVCEALPIGGELRMMNNTATWITDAPATYCHMTISKTTASDARCSCSPVGAGVQPTYIGSYKSQITPKWSGWVPQTTATPPKEYDLPLAAGKIARGYAAYRKRQDGYIVLHAEIARTDGANLSGIEDAFNLPPGYRPYRDEVRHIDLSSGGAPAGYAHLHIYSSGLGQIAGIAGNVQSAFCDCEFPTA